MPELSEQTRQETVAASERASERVSRWLAASYYGETFFFQPPELFLVRRQWEGGTKSQGSRELPRRQVIRRDGLTPYRFKLVRLQKPVECVWPLKQFATDIFWNANRWDMNRIWQSDFFFVCQCVISQSGNSVFLVVSPQNKNAVLYWPACHSHILQGKNRCDAWVANSEWILIITQCTTWNVPFLKSAGPSYLLHSPLLSESSESLLFFNISSATFFYFLHSCFPLFSSAHTARRTRAATHAGWRSIKSRTPSGLPVATVVQRDGFRPVISFLFFDVNFIFSAAASWDTESGRDRGRQGWWWSQEGRVVGWRGEGGKNTHMLPVCWEAAEPHPRRRDSAGKPAGLQIELRLWLGGTWAATAHWKSVHWTDFTVTTPSH